MIWFEKCLRAVWGSKPTPPETKQASTKNRLISISYVCQKLKQLDLRFSSWGLQPLWCRFNCLENLRFYCRSVYAWPILSFPMHAKRNEAHRTIVIYSILLHGVDNKNCHLNLQMHFLLMLAKTYPLENRVFTKYIKSLDLLCTLLKHKLMPWPADCPGSRANSEILSAQCFRQAIKSFPNQDTRYWNGHQLNYGTPEYRNLEGPIFETLG